MFNELIASTVHVAEVGVRGVPSKFGGWRCRACGFVDIGMYYFLDTAHSPHNWISVEDLPPRLPTCFTIGKGKGLTLGFSRERWEGLVGKAGTRGLVSSEIGVVDADRVQHPTDLPFLDDLQKKASQ
ncbi:MAG: hypothetical protein HY700_05295 [Gemmatimonadetes bacterium]|nr:hypothetical protein [Gemmatimonadota bacterium]